MTKKETAIINNLRENAANCSAAAAELKEECKALYEEVKDFIEDENLDLDDYLYGVELTLKDGAELTFNTDTETFFHNRDTEVRVWATSYTYRDDFVEDYVGYASDRIDELCEKYGHDGAGFVDELNDAGELLYYSLLKTALTVAKERMAEWTDEDEDED